VSGLTIYGLTVTFAEAILDRLIHRAVRVTLTGESMGKQGANLTHVDQAKEKKEVVSAGRN
jgi:hypothetical protein